MPSNFPGSVDVFKTIPTPTTTRTDLSDASDDTLSTRLQQHSDGIVAVENYLLNATKSASFINLASGSINCSGATSVSFYFQVNTPGSGGTSFTLTLSNLGIGVPVAGRFDNFSGSQNWTLIIQGTTPSLTAWVVGAANAQTVANTILSSAGLVIGQGAVFFTFCGSFLVTGSPILQLMWV